MNIAKMAPVMPRSMMVLMFSLMVSATSVSMRMLTPFISNSAFNWSISARTRSESSMTLTCGDFAMMQVMTSLPLTRE